MAAAALFALAGYQVTGEPASLRFLSRYSAALIEIDRWLPGHIDDLQLAARDRAQGFVEVRDLPIPVELPAGGVIAAEESQVRAQVLAVMARRLYEDGSGAFRDVGGVSRRPGYDQPAYWVSALLNRDAHGFWTAALPIALLLLLAFGASVLHSGRSLPGAIAVGGGLGLLASTAVWLLAELAEGAFSSPLDKEIALITRDGAWIGVRNAGAVLASSVGLVLLLRFLERERRPLRASSPYPPDLPPA
jgi:hypothetical protein